MRFLPVLAFFMPLAGLATTFMAQDFGLTVNATPVIVRGTVGSSYADWGKASDGTRRIYTFYDLQIAEVIKGNASGTSLVFREMGGEKDGVGMNVSGAAHFDRGEDVVLLLGDKNPDGSYDVRSMMMGKLTLQHADDGSDALNGPALAYQNPGEMVHGDEGSSGETPRPAPSQKRWTLDSLRQFVGKAPPASSATAVIPTPAASKNSQAPRLQPTPSEGSDDGSDHSDSRAPSYIKWAGAIVGLGAVFAIARSSNRKKRKKP